MAAATARLLLRLPPKFDDLDILIFEGLPFGPVRPDVFDASSPTARRRGTHTLVQLSLTRCLSTRFENYPTNGHIVYSCFFRSRHVPTVVYTAPTLLPCSLTLIPVPADPLLPLPCSMPLSRSFREPIAPPLVWGGALREAQCTSLNALRTNHQL
ncbi:hypothetical protein B0H13DRAFT_2299997 [Mycena leptocephala]|nr:hypothetical protein B0H13DRAFT_2299997 [Mycena leptocephala]